MGTQQQNQQDKPQKRRPNIPDTSKNTVEIGKERKKKMVPRSGEEELQKQLFQKIRKMWVSAGLEESGENEANGGWPWPASSHFL